MKAKSIESRGVVVCVVFILYFFINTSISYASSTRGVTDSTVKIGAIFDLTGPLVTTIKPLVEAIRNVTRYENERGGIHGRKMKLILEDDRYSIPAAVAAFKKLVFRDKVFALIGPGSTGETRALSDQIMKHKLPSMAYAADRDVIEPYKKYLFLPLDTYGNQIGVILDYIVETTKPKKPKIALACVDAGAKVPILRGIKKWSKFFNLNVKIIMVPMNVLDTTSEVLNMKRDKVEYIVITHTIPTAGLFLKDLKRFRLNATVFATYSLTSEDIIKIAGEQAKYFYGVHPYSSWYDEGPGMEELRKITLEYHPGTEKPYRSKNYSGGWVGMKLIYEGIKRSGRELSVDKFIKGMESIRNYNTKGICGPITYTSKSHEGLKYDKVFHADPSSGKLIPVTKWRKAPEYK
ncbi:MAG: ABC transporter substrate-binding protein [Spirochaetota bacterium]|nr:ABC transporter substrate-binding protein [Spirochaetota bacterium]